MIERATDQIPNKITTSGIFEKIKKTTYSVLPDSTTTVCQLTLENGFTIIGTSACVDPAQFNAALGEKYSFERAFDEIWQLEGYLLLQKRFEAGL